MPWSSHSCISKEIVAIDMFTALKPSLEHDRKYIVQLLQLYGDSNQNKVADKTSPVFPLFMFAYSYRLFKKFNRASLNYSLEALCRLPGGGYTHAALETL